MEMGNDQFPTLPDLRQLIAARNPFPAAANPQFITAPPANYFADRNMLFSHHQRPPSASTSNFQETGLMVRFNDSNYINNNNHHHYFSTGGGGGVEMESSATTSGGYWSSVIGINNNDNNIYGGGSGGNNRWPMQETLCLLEIRSRLHSKFKEANHKGPLWDELSRIMSEEHGYNRSGKKCKEKFENLYKYYKKTKEGKSGRQDGKNYRFFRQLEALFGSTSEPKFITQNQPNSLLLQPNPSDVTTNPPQTINTNNLISTNQEHQLITLSNFSNTSHDHFETSSSTNHNYNDPFHHHDNDLSAIALLLNKDHHHHRHRRRHHHDYHYNNIRLPDGHNEKEKDVREIMEPHMNKLLETQETWMERLMTSIEDNERDRSRKEKEWRKEQNAIRKKEQDELRAKEKAWSEARGSALMEILTKFPTISSHDKKAKKKKST